jgi:hypothetical protein
MSLYLCKSWLYETYRKLRAKTRAFLLIARLIVLNSKRVLTITASSITNALFYNIRNVRITKLKYSGKSAKSKQKRL